MEIYTNSSVRTAYLDVPVTPIDGTLDVVITDSAGNTPYTVSTVTMGTDSQMSVVIPYYFVQNENLITINWSFSYIEDGQTYQTAETTYVDVVAPIISLATLRSMFQPDSTNEEIFGVEAAVRHIINAHTGQSFGKFIGTKDVYGGNTNSLALPARLMSLTSVNGQAAGQNFEIVGAGWYLKFYPWGVPPVKADYNGLHMHSGGVIHNPNNVRVQDFPKRFFSIEGVWGYNEVPADVKEAAKLLVYDYATQEVSYRDRYLTSMTAADWRIQFNSGAFAKTGNVRADQLLSNYVLKRGWAVL